jgi:cytosine/adenosine deaminase-related metal-dependent hydrolase
MRTKLKGAYVVGFDGAAGRHVLYRGGEVVFDDRIHYVGERYDGEVDRTIDAAGCLISPGLIDMHALMDVGIHPIIQDRPRERGMYRPESWVRDPEARPVFNEAEVRAGAEQTLLVLLRSGVTTFCGITAMVFKRWFDPLWEPEVYLEVAVRYGLRAYLSHHFRAGAHYVAADGAQGTVWDEAKGFEGLEHNIRFIERYHGKFNGRIGGLLFPYTCDQVTAPLLRATRQAATTLGVGIRLHFAQSEAEVAEIADKHGGKTPIEFLESLGFLGKDVMLTHCLYGRGHRGGPWVSDDELAILADHQVTVTSCPWIYAMRGGYLNAFSRYLAAGVNVCLGTDTHPNDLIREMRYAAIMGKTAEGSASAATAQEVYNAVTLNAANFLGRNDIGRLAPGCKADITVVDLERVALGPYDDPIRTLVYFASLADVKHVFVDGRQLVQDGRCTVADEKEVLSRARPVAQKTKATLVNWDRLGRQADQLYPPSFEIRGEHV